MGKSVRDAMTTNPCTIDAEKPVAYAAKMMKQENVGIAPIVEGDRLVGTVTDRDIAIRVVAEGKDPESTKVKDIASINLVTVNPRQDLDEALKLMAKHQVRRLPVTEEGGQCRPPKGADLVRDFLHHAPSLLLVAAPGYVCLGNQPDEPAALLGYG